MAQMVPIYCHWIFPGETAHAPASHPPTPVSRSRPGRPLCSRPRPFPRHPGRSAPGQTPRLRGRRTEGQTPPRCALAEPGKPPWSAESPASTGDGDPCSLEGELALRPSPPATRSHGEQEGDSVPPVLNRSCRTGTAASIQASIQNGMRRPRGLLAASSPHPLGLPRLHLPHMPGGCGGGSAHRSTFTHSSSIFQKPRPHTRHCSKNQVYSREYTGRNF